MSPIYLDVNDDDDDVAIIDRPLPEQGPPLSPQLYLSSSPSSSSSASESSSDPPSSPSPIVKIENDPFDMTGSSVHQFPSYRNLQSWMKEYATALGFEVRWNNTGSVNATHHGGTIRCWCHEMPPGAVTEEIIPSTAPLRAQLVKTSSQESTVWADHGILLDYLHPSSGFQVPLSHRSGKGGGCGEVDRGCDDRNWTIIYATAADHVISLRCADWRTGAGRPAESSAEAEGQASREKTEGCCREGAREEGKALCLTDVLS